MRPKDLAFATALNLVIVALVIGASAHVDVRWLLSGLAFYVVAALAYADHVRGK